MPSVLTQSDATRALIEASGGGAALGKHTGARETFWNIRATRPLVYPPAAFGPPSMNLVGLHAEQPSVTPPPS